MITTAASDAKRKWWVWRIFGIFTLSFHDLSRTVWADNMLQSTVDKILSVQLITHISPLPLVIHNVVLLLINAIISHEYSKEDYGRDMKISPENVEFSRQRKCFREMGEENWKENAYEKKENSLLSGSLLRVWLWEIKCEHTNQKFTGKLEKTLHAFEWRHELKFSIILSALHKSSVWNLKIKSFWYPSTLNTISNTATSMLTLFMKMFQPI